MKTSENKSFLKFAGVIGMEHWTKMGSGMMGPYNFETLKFSFGIV